MRGETVKKKGKYVKKRRKRMIRSVEKKRERK